MPALNQRLAFSLLATLAGFTLLQYGSLYFFHEGPSSGFTRLQQWFRFDADAFYHSSSLTLAALLQPVMVVPLALMTLLFWSTGNLYLPYERSADRWIIALSATLLCWELVTYDTNYFLNTSFTTDRIILITMAASLWYRPTVLPLFAALALIYRSQFSYPLGGFPLFDKRIFFDLFFLYLVFASVRRFLHSELRFAFLALCLVGANYFATGVAKIWNSPHGLEWITQNDLRDFVTNNHLRGWWGENMYHRLYNLAETWGVFLQILITLIELSGIFLLRSRKLSLILLSSFFVLHLGIFLFGSMLFWKWMAIDALLFVLIWQNRIDCLSKKHMYWSLPVIVLSFVWLHPFRIAWYDTPYTQFFRYEVTDTQQETFTFTKNQFNPYHQLFQYDHFPQLIDRSLLPISGFGYTAHYKMADVIKKHGKDWKVLGDKFGSNKYDPVFVKKFRHFLSVYFQHYNERLKKRIVFTRLRAPHHLHNAEKERVYDRLHAVHSVKVWFEEWWRSGNEVKRVRHEKVMELIIPSP